MKLSNFFFIIYLVYMNKMFLAEQKYPNTLYEIHHRIYIVVKKKKKVEWLVWYYNTTLVVFSFVISVFNVLILMKIVKVTGF